MLAQAHLVDGRYALVRQLGAGGFAEVWLADDQQTSRQVALKLPRGARSALAGPASDRSHREFAAAARLEHPNIVRVLATGESDGEPYLVLEYVDGPNLRDRLRSSGPLPIAEVEALGRNLTSALGHAHSRGVLHNDIKPENILLGPDGAKLTDFGAAAGLQTTLTATPADFAATVAYLAPEVLQGAEPTPRSDIYALGLVLYEATAGRLPWDGASAGALAAQRFATPPRPVTAYRPEAPAALSDALDRALWPEPEGRFTSAAEFGLALQGVQATVPLKRAAAVAPAGPARPVDSAGATRAPESRRHRPRPAWLPLTALGAGGLAAVVGLAGLLNAIGPGGQFNGRPPEASPTAVVELVASETSPAAQPATPTATATLPPPTPTPKPIITLPGNGREDGGDQPGNNKPKEKKDRPGNGRDDDRDDD